MESNEVMRRIDEKSADYVRGFSMVLSFREMKISDIEDAYKAGAEEAIALKEGRIS